MKNLILYILFLFALLVQLLFGGKIFAEELGSDEYFITGKNTDLEFGIDKGKLLDWQKDAAKEAKWDKATGNFSGMIYIDGIGFADIWELKTTCPRKNCMISWKIRAESIGEIAASGFIYTDTNKITGNLYSANIWKKFSLDGISITKNTISINELGNLEAGNTATLTLSQGVENATLTTKIGSITRAYGPINGNSFSNVDLSLAGEYEFTLQTNGKTYTYQTNVKPWVPDMHLQNAGLISEGQKEATTITFPSPLYAKPQIQSAWLALRDKFGNTVSSGEIFIKFLAEDNEQISDFPEESLFGDFTKKGNEYTKTIENYTENSFPIALYIPPKSLKITEILYNDTKINNFSEKNLDPKAPITASVNIPSALVVNQKSNFSVDFVKNIDLPGAQIIGAIDSQDIAINNDACSTDFCKKFGNNTFQIPINAANPQINLMANSADNSPIFATLTTYIAYPFNDIWYVYKNNSEKLEFKKDEIEHLVFLGQSGNSSSAANNVENGNYRVNLLNQIRKNIGYLSRNNTTTNTNTYEIFSGDRSLTSTDTKRSYIATSGDIYIDENIENYGPPKTIIALDGNIKIAPNVTEIHATLVAGKSILSSDNSTPDKKSYQLYIRGSVVADNTLGSFQIIRENFENLDEAKKSTTAKVKKINDQIIVEHNPAIITNPPPGLENFRE